MANPGPTLDQLLREYEILTLIMENLNFYDFRNLRLAGSHVPATSGRIQRRHLVQIHCNEFRETFDNTSECGNAPPDVEMNPCQGFSSISRRGDPRVDFQDPQLSHLHDGSDENTCFWVCIECRNRSQARYQNPGHLMGPSYVRLCEIHSHEHGGFPSNACHCGNNAIGDWRSSMCILTSLDLIRRRARRACFFMPLHMTLFGFWTVILRPHKKWTCWMASRLEQAQDALNSSTKRFLSTFGLRPIELHVFKWGVLCPIKDCRRPGWNDIRGMRMCLECKAVFPARNATP